LSNALRVTREERVALLVFDAPEKRNALTEPLMHEYAAAIEELRGDGDVRAVVLGSNGPAFSAGGDMALLEEQLSLAPEENRRRMGRFYRRYLTALSLDVPTIAAIGGDAIGAGLTIALSYDIRIVAEQARLGFTFLNLGLHPGMGTTHLLPLLVGDARAAELIFTGKLISGRESVDIGLSNRAVSAERVLETAMTMAHEIAAKPAQAMRLAKRALVQRKLQGLEEALDYEAMAQMNGFASDEMRAIIESWRNRKR
jgi:enoyl-CoA hydratase/carnithine racemase